MAYLRLKDYNLHIQRENLDQVICRDSTTLMAAENAAQEEIESYLKSKYLTDAEFTDTPQFSIAALYTLGARADYNFPEYQEVTYAIGDYVTFGGRAFICITAISTPEEFTIAKWTDIGSDSDLFYLFPSYDDFDLDTPYAVGKTVFYLGKLYTALTASYPISHDAQLNAVTVDNVGNVNTVPGTGTSQWSTGVDYLITGVMPHKAFSSFAVWSNVTAYTAGQFISYNGAVYFATANSTNKVPGTNINYWVKFRWVLGDNRSQQIMMVMIDIALYHVHSRIAPRNIPELRVTRYESCVDWLKRANNGKLTPKLKLIQSPKSGRMILWGGGTKLNNSY